jgi:sensor domain CHASE-containing protein
MIKFFRKIRQTMLTENKFSKYLLYAIGEIVLVVIGILIALSINNWNQNRVQTKLVNGILIEIYANLQADQKELEDDIEFSEKFIENLSFNQDHRKRLAEYYTYNSVNESYWKTPKQKAKKTYNSN